MLEDAVEKAIEDVLSGAAGAEFEDGLPFAVATSRHSRRLTKRRALRLAKRPSTIAWTGRHRGKWTRRIPRTSAAAKLRLKWTGRRGGER
ncbi:hypothetical protein [Jiella sp. M17.18]|uniref:hypothetical protein n=1 Tax=Jiella sp. M17.18 TaxID=3234247 RepID=UPI0034DFBF05